MLYCLSFPLLFVFLAPFVAGDDYFIFNTTFECNYRDRQNFSSMVQFYEVDSVFSNHDEITKKFYKTVRTGTTEHMFEGKLAGDEILSDGYEVYAKIWHTCTADQKEVLMTLNLTPECEAGQGICHYSFHRNLTNDWGVYDQKADFKYDLTPFEGNNSLLHSNDNKTLFFQMND